MDLEVSPANLQRGTTNTATVQLNVEETQLTRDLVHKRQVVWGGFHPAVRRLILAGRATAPRSVEAAALPSTLLQSRLHPSAACTAFRPICLYVLALPCEGFCQLCSHLQLFSARSCQFRISQKCRRFTRRRGEAAEAVGRVSGVPRDTL